MDVRKGLVYIMMIYFIGHAVAEQSHLRSVTVGNSTAHDLDLRLFGY
jgi:hypothetical protein